MCFYEGYGSVYCNMDIKILELCLGRSGDENAIHDDMHKILKKVYINGEEMMGDGKKKNTQKIFRYYIYIMKL